MVITLPVVGLLSKWLVSEARAAWRRRPSAPLLAAAVATAVAGSYAALAFAMKPVLPEKLTYHGVEYLRVSDDFFNVSQSAPPPTCSHVADLRKDRLWPLRPVGRVGLATPENVRAMSASVRSWFPRGFEVFAPADPSRAVAPALADAIYVLLRRGCYVRFEEPFLV